MSRFVSALIACATVAIPSAARADEQRPTGGIALRLTTGFDLAYPMGLYAGVSVAGSWHFITAEVGAQTSPGVHNGGNRGAFAVIGARVDVIAPTDSGWAVGLGASAGLRTASREPEEGATASVLGAMGVVAIDAVRWNKQGYGLTFRLAGTATKPIGWDEMAFYYDPKPSMGVDLSMGLARRW